MAEGVGASVSKTVRETVEAVRALGKSGVSLGDISKQLGLDNTTVSRRVKDAGGYLRNMETRSGMAACIVIGDPLPDELEMSRISAARQSGCEARVNLDEKVSPDA